MSVVIPFYGDPTDTVNLIEQLQAQEGAPELQIIVSDDASPTPFPPGEGYEVARRESNGGFGSSVNSGAARARHARLMILNSDLTLSPTTISDWLAAAEPSWPSVTAPAMITPEYQAHVAWRFLKPRHLVLEWLAPAARFHATDWFSTAMGHDMRAFRAGVPTETDWLVGAALLLPADEYRAIGGFDESFFMNCEEVDLQRRLRDRGLRATYLPTVSVGHASGGSSDSTKRAQWVTDSRFRYMRKWGGARRLRAGLWAASLVNVVWQAARRLAGADVRPLQNLRREVALIEHGWKASR